MKNKNVVTQNVIGDMVVFRFPNGSTEHNISLKNPKMICELLNKALELSHYDRTTLIDYLCNLD